MEIKEILTDQVVTPEEPFKLSGIIKLDSFFYGLFDRNCMIKKANQIPIVPKNFSEELRYESAHVSVMNDLFTIVPYEQSDSENSFTQQISDNTKKTYSQHLPSLNATILFSLYPEQKSFYRSFFADTEISHIVGDLAIALGNFEIGDTIHLCKMNEHFVLIGFKDSQLVVANTFYGNDISTVLYYLNLTCHLHSFDSNNIILELSGDFFVSPNDISLIKDYFPTATYKKAGSLEDHQSQRSSINYPLYIIAECA